MPLFSLESFCQNKIKDLHLEHRYRVFTYLERLQNNPPFALYHPEGVNNGTAPKEVSVWCTNDYLGLSHHPRMIEAQVQACQTLGTSSGGTRNISGSMSLHAHLEKAIARLHDKEKGLIFSSGYVANEATLTTFGDHIPDLIFLSDEKVHASMIQGMRHSKAQRQIFKHNNLEDLENHLKALPLSQPKMIVFVSVYSMDGDFAPIQEICDLADKYNAMTYLDEVHGVGVYGQHGAGLANATHQQSRITIIQGNFAKGFGSYGGYIAADRNVIDFIRSYASGFIFTTSVPPAITAASLKALEILKDSPQIQMNFHSGVKYFKEKIQRTSIPFKDNGSHILPIVVGDAEKCTMLSQNLLKHHNIYVQPINFPTVSRGTERLRVTITPHHSFELIDYFISSLETQWHHTVREFKTVA